MSTHWAGVIFIVSLAVAIAVAYRPFGDYMYRSLHPKRHSRVRARHLQAGRRQPGRRAVLGRLRPQRAGLLGGQHPVPLPVPAGAGQAVAEPGLPARSKPDQAWNTAVSFVTNTNWQSYSGESTMGHLVQMAGLAVQNFVSAAVGVAVVVALVRGFARAEDRPAGQLLGRPGAHLRADPAAGRRRRRDRVHRGRHGAEPVRRHRRDHLGRWHPAHHRWSGGQPGGHQGARHQRWRLLQRQLGAPVREPDHVDELDRRSS